MAVREKLIYAIGLEVDAAKNGLKDFRKSVQDADGATGKLKAGASSAFASIKANAGIAALAVGGTMVAAGAKALTQFTDLALSVEKFSKATGASTEEASRWVEVAGDIGISTETIQGGFVKLEKAIASGVPAVKDLGIELQRNADGSADVTATMLQAIEALGGIEDPTLKAKAASELFGRGFAEMSELVLGDAGKIKTALGEVSGAKIIDEKEIEKAKRNRENLDRLKDTIENLALSLGETLGPALEGAADGLESLNTIMSTLKLDKVFALAGKFDDLGTAIGHFFSPWNIDARRASAAITGAFNDAEQAASEFDTTLLDGLSTFADVRQKVLDLTGSQHAANRVALDWLQSQRDVGAAVSETGEVAETATSRWEGLAVPLEAASGAFATMPGVAFDTAAAVDATAEAADKAAQAADDHAQALDAAREAMEKQRSAALDLVGGDIAVRDAQRRATEQAEELNDVLADQETTLSEAGAAIDEAADAHLNAASAAAEYRAKQLEANGQTVDARTKAQLMKEELQNLVGQLDGPLAAAIQGYIDDLSAIPREVNTSVNTFFNSRGDNVAQRFGARATGGPVDAGGMYRVNENGSELLHENGKTFLMPGANGVVEPLGGTVGVRATGGANYTINLYGGQATPQGVVDAIKKYERMNGTGWRT